MAYNPQKPYNELPPLPPKTDVETKDILKKAIAATRALAELKGLGNSIPNQGILIDSLILQESKASSELENIVTTNDRLFQAFSAKAGNIDQATKEVLRYREALWKGYRTLQKREVLSTNLFIEIVQTITANTAGIRKLPGTAIKNITRDEILYTPPEGEDSIRRKLADLEKFIHADDALDPLVKLALIHYQFEAIHPFLDGNGRTGRILNILFLVQKGLLDLPVLYHSKYIIEHKADYYRLLSEVTTKKQWKAWILFMLEAIRHTAEFTRRRIVEIQDLMRETTERAKRGLPQRVYSKELLELIFRQPYTKGQFLVESGIAKRQTAAEYLKELEKIGILKMHKVGKETLYLNRGLYDLLSK
jgi:Fic family protein